MNFVSKIEQYFKFIRPRIFFNQTSLSGKIGGTIYCLTSSSLYLVQNGAIILLFIGLCEQQRAFSEQFRYKIQHFDKENAKNSLKEIIEFHIAIKE